MLLVAIIGLAADLISKEIAFRTIADQPFAVNREDVLAITQAGGRSLGQLIPPHTPITVIPSVLDFTLVLNPGAVFGIGAGQRGFFVIFTGFALAFALWVFTRWTEPRNRLTHVSIGLLIAGGLGNLYDRVLFGCVRDFIHPLPYAKFPFGWTIAGNREIWPWVSNVADLLLIIGIIGLAIHLWRAEPRGK